MSLLIIGIMLFIANKKIRKKQSNVADMSTIGTLGEEENTENQNSNTQNSDNIENEGGCLIDNVIVDSTVIGNEECSMEEQNVIEQNTVEENVIKESLNGIDIGILSTSALFLIFTIIFSIIFIKHQQKPKKKASK